MMNEILKFVWLKLIIFICGFFLNLRIYVTEPIIVISKHLKLEKNYNIFNIIDQIKDYKGTVVNQTCPLRGGHLKLQLLSL